MAEGAIFLNSGPLLNGERLETLEETPEWADDAAAREALLRIREAYEKQSTLLAGTPTVDETRFFIVNPTLHALGFSHSVQEPVEVGGERTARVDYVCFAGSSDFYEAQPVRGSVAFFRSAVAIAKAIAWNQPLSLTAEQSKPAEDGTRPIDPAAEIDALLRATGLDYGILTNGCEWRIVHRATSATLNTFFQADMIAAVKGDFDDFKRFYLLFRKASLVKDDSGMSFLDRLLR